MMDRFRELVSSKKRCASGRTRPTGSYKVSLCRLTGQASEAMKHDYRCYKVAHLTMLKQPQQLVF